MALEGEVELQPLMVRYFHLVMDKSKLGARGGREVLTLRSVMDALLLGETPKALDILMQRLKALEATSMEDLPWAVASHLEVVDPAKPSTISRKERELAFRQQLKDVRVGELLSRHQSQSSNARTRSRSRSPFVSHHPDPSPLPAVEKGEARKVTFSTSAQQPKPPETRRSAFQKKNWWGKQKCSTGHK